MRTYGEDDDEVVDWISAGTLYVGVKMLTPWERKTHGLLPGSAKLMMAVTGIYIGDFSFETVWTEYFFRSY